jgi:MFS family permease
MSFVENAELDKQEQRRDKYGDPVDDDNEKKCCPQMERKLIPAKLFYFLYFSSLGALLPYLALYYKQMKLTPSQVGILMGLKPFVEFVCTPFWGAFADRFKKGKSVLLLSLIVTALSQLSLHNFISL